MVQIFTPPAEGFETADQKIVSHDQSVDGWIELDGVTKSVNIDDEPDLYRLLGTRYGSTGDGKFNLPAKDTISRTLIKR